MYDGENPTGEVLGIFYGGHLPPKEGTYSSSNHMFVIFRSDENASYTGFSAFYCEGKCPGKCYPFFVEALSIFEVLICVPVYWILNE